MKKIAFAISLLLCFIILIGPINILRKTIFPSNIDKDVNRYHMNTGNTTRVSVNNSSDLSIDLARLHYPSIDSETSPDGLIILQSEKWSDVLRLLPLTYKYKSPIIQIQDEVDVKLTDYLTKVQLNGINELNDVELILISSDISKIESMFNSYDMNKKLISYSSSNELQNKLNDLPTYLDNMSYGFIIDEKNPEMSIPVGTWLVHSRNSLPLFMNENGELLNSSRNILNEVDLEKIYAVGSNELEDKSIDVVDVNYITAKSSDKLSIEFAKFFDNDTLVGWNAVESNEDSGHNFIIASKDEPLVGSIATQLSLKGKVGPLLWSNKNSLSSKIESYLWQLKPDFWNTPAEGPFNHVWVIGNNNILNYGIQARIDYTQEIVSYEMMGEGGVSGLDVLSILWILSSILSAIWVSVHIFTRLKKLYLITKMMWILTTLVLGPIGLIIYIFSYKTRPWMKMNNNIMWKRPLWNQALVATVIGLSFGAASMISTAYIVSSRGMPLVPISNNFYLFGNPMIIQMIYMYLIAFILNSFVFMPAIKMKMNSLTYKESVLKALPSVFISMTSVSIGMMITSWWFHMVYSPMMPEEEHILWWGFMHFSTIVGALIGFIPNLFLVRYGKKMGTS